MNTRLLNTKNKDDEKTLRTISKEVSFEQDNVLDLINELKKYALSMQCFSMSMPQINIFKKIIYLKTLTDTSGLARTDENLEIIMINPVIKNRRGNQYYWESCISMGTDEAWEVGYTCRPYSLDVSYYNEKGDLVNKHLEGFPAIVLSHEYDHLYGCLHTDNAEKVKLASSEDKKILRKKEPRLVIDETGEYKNDYLYK